MTDHRNISDTFLRQSIEEYVRGDFLQASEKAWGAVAHYIQARAEEEGRGCGSHKQVLEKARWLTGGNPAQHDAFQAIRLLHVNFYQDALNHEEVLSGIGTASRLLAAWKLQEGGGQPVQVARRWA